MGSLLATNSQLVSNKEENAYQAPQLPLTQPGAKGGGKPGQSRSAVSLGQAPTRSDRVQSLGAVRYQADALPQGYGTMIMQKKL